MTIAARTVPARRTGPAVRWLAPALLVLVVVYAVARAWSTRFLTDDGFINVRIVNQVFDGHGLVFNRGERVEAGTSPAWIFALTAGKVLLFGLRTEWVAVVAGILAFAASIGFALAASARLFGSWFLLPFGAIVFLALPPAAQYATSGLETSLVFSWLAATYWSLVVVAHDNRRGRRLLSAFLIGLGPMVRPDLLVVCAIYATVLFVLVRPRTARSVLAIAVAGLAVPAAYEVFRICYFGALLPNTGFAKEATRSNWTFGRKYLIDTVAPYWLWLAAILVIIALVHAWRLVDSSRRLVLLAPVVSGVVYGFFVIRGGGDHMHARMLLPSIFAILLPVAALPVRRMSWVLVVAALTYAVIPVVAGGPPYDRVGPDEITNEHSYYTGLTGRSHPVAVADFVRHPFAVWGLAAREHARAGDRVYDFFGVRGAVSLPLREDVSYDGVLAVPTIGIAGVLVGDDVYVADLLSLADPIGSRFEVGRRGRPGHEKLAPLAWSVARFTEFSRADEVPGLVRSDEVTSARAAYNCPQVRHMVERAADPLTFSRALHNAREAFTTFRLRIPSDPLLASRC